jgi:hypothetical protein
VAFKRGAQAVARGLFVVHNQQQGLGDILSLQFRGTLWHSHWAVGNQKEKDNARLPSY